MENASNLFIAIGKPRLTLVFMVAQVAVLAGAGLPLTLLYGALGTCAAVGLAFAVGMALIYRDIVRELGINMLRELALPLLVTLLTLAGALLLNRLTGLNEAPLLLRVMLKAGYAFVAFYGLMLLLQPRALLERVRLIWQAARGR
ncbi:MAG: hypothetical protein HC893_11340 [Chloroflexaceae bacterium]|nr:hypothetical protein [Chloroflexaceae bacterium]